MGAAEETSFQEVYFLFDTKNAILALVERMFRGRFSIAHKRKAR